jgi:cupin
VSTKGTRQNGSASLENWRQSLFDNLLRGVRLQSSVYFRPELQAPWGIGMAKDCAIFHIVDQGSVEKLSPAPLALSPFPASPSLRLPESP